MIINNFLTPTQITIYHCTWHWHIYMRNEDILIAELWHNNNMLRSSSEEEKTPDENVSSDVSVCLKISKTNNQLCNTTLIRSINGCKKHKCTKINL